MNSGLDLILYVMLLRKAFVSSSVSSTFKIRFWHSNLHLLTRSFTPQNASGSCLHLNLRRFNASPALTAWCRHPASPRPLKSKDTMKDEGRRAAPGVWYADVLTVGATAAVAIRPPARSSTVGRTPTDIKEHRHSGLILVDLVHSIRGILKRCSIHNLSPQHLELI